MRAPAVNASVELHEPTALPPWIPNREEALRRLDAFVPHAGRAYAAQRNFDRGPGRRDNVSLLSPYIRHRVLTEVEVVRSVLARHTLAAAEKFISEIFWRTYWKGWLQTHPAAWSGYRTTLDQRLGEASASAPLRAAVDRAVSGSTGIDAFDAWAHELVATNYLHNHARMWFASIWIFTLELPWEIGADFFLRNLLDGDPASNTLSWRWVAGLHTRGKRYAATRDNIRRYTEDRFAVDATLARSPAPLVDVQAPLRGLTPLPLEPSTEEPALYLVHDDDLAGDLAELPRGIRGVCALNAAAGRSPLALGPAVPAFTAAVARDATARIAAVSEVRDFGLLDSADAGPAATALARAAEACGARRIVTPFAPVGPVRDLLDGAFPQLREGGLACDEAARRYDALSWPAATGGFFKLRGRIGPILTELGLRSG